MNQSGPFSVTLPADIRCAADYARFAQETLESATFHHLEGGSGADVSAAANLRAFAETAIVPRILRRVSDGDTTCRIGEIERPHPIMLAPVGSQALYHPDAEKASAAGAAATKTCLIASTMSSLSLESIAEAAGADRWFQLYFQRDRGVTLDLARRAQAAGYRAIVVTVDTPIQLPSLRALAAGFRPPADSANLRGYALPSAPGVPAGASEILQGLMAEAPTFDDIAWLCGQIDLPLWVKGVMHGDDAEKLIEAGASGIIVSNHGGRSLDGAPASLSRLAGVRRAIGPVRGLLFDGGIRSGSDVFKALSTGADAVLVGRLQAYALAVAGALGVGHMIKLLRQELEACMALAGCATLADIRDAELVPFNGRQGA